MDYKEILKRHGVADHERLAAALDEILDGALDVPIVVEKGGVIPTCASEGSGGYDIHVPEDTVIKKGRFCVPMNIRFSLPKGYVAIIKPRSGFTLRGMEVVNVYKQVINVEAKVNDGVIDSDYIGIVGVLMQSDVDSHILRKGTAVAQLLIVKARKVNWIPVESLEDTERGEGAYGHSDAL